MATPDTAPHDVNNHKQVKPGQANITPLQLQLRTHPLRQDHPLRGGLAGESLHEGGVPEGAPGCGFTDPAALGPQGAPPNSIPVEEVPRRSPPSQISNPNHGGRFINHHNGDTEEYFEPPGSMPGHQAGNGNGNAGRRTNRRNLPHHSFDDKCVQPFQSSKPVCHHYPLMDVNEIVQVEPGSHQIPRCHVPQSEPIQYSTTIDQGKCQERHTNIPCIYTEEDIHVAAPNAVHRTQLEKGSFGILSGACSHGQDTGFCNPNLSETRTAGPIVVNNNAVHVHAHSQVSCTYGREAGLRSDSHAKQNFRRIIDHESVGHSEPTAMVKPLPQEGTLCAEEEEEEEDTMPICLRRILAGKHRGNIPGETFKMSPEGDWPVHCPKVPELNLASVLEAIPADYASRIAELKNQMEQTPQVRIPVRNSDVSQEVIRQMLETDTIEEYVGPLAHNSVLFLIAEESKCRYRIITWPIVHNADISYEWSSLAFQADPVDLAALVQEAEYGCSFDMKCSFYQIPCTGNFIFQVGDRKYRMKRLPMGYVGSCEIVQLILQGIGALVKRAYPSVHYKVHVDNILFYDKQLSTMMAAEMYFLTLAMAFSITVGDVVKTSAVVNFHTLVLAFRSKTVQFSQKAMTKLKTIRSCLGMSLRSKGNVTWPLLCTTTARPSFLRLISQLLYMSRILFVSSKFRMGSMAQHYQVMQIARASAYHLQQGRQNISLTKGIIAQILHLANIIPLTPWSIEATCTQQPDCEFYTDASCTGGGYYLQDGTHEASAGWPWIERCPSKMMAVAEAAALAEAIVSPVCKDFCKNKVLCSIKIDNMTVLHCLRKGYSAAQQLNLWIAKILANLRGSYQFEYVATSENQADKMSRILWNEDNTTNIGISWKIEKH